MLYKLTLVISFIVLTMSISTNSVADIAPSNWTCSSHDFSVRSYSSPQMADDSLEVIEITATMDTPHPGFTYEMSLKEIKNDIANIELNIKRPAPEMSYIAVISPINIHETIHLGEKLINGAKITIIKDFNWGETEVTCEQ